MLPEKPREFVDPVSLWVRHSKTAKEFSENVDITDKEAFTVSNQPSHSKWYPTGETTFNRIYRVYKVLKNWPQNTERRIWRVSETGLILMPVLTGTFMIDKIRKSFLLEPRHRNVIVVLHAVVWLPCSFMGHHMFISDPLFSERLKCSTCAVGRQFLLNLGLGVIGQTITVPLICMHYCRSEGLYRVPKLENFTAVLSFCYLSVKPIFAKYTLKLVLLHAVFAWAGIYSLLYTMDRVVPILNTEPELFDSLSQDSSRFQKLKSFLSSSAAFRKLFQRAE